MVKFPLSIIKKKIQKNYLLLFLDKETMQERYSLHLNRIVFFIFLLMISLLCVSATIALVAFTPVKKLFPGFVNESLFHEQELKRLIYRTDSLQESLNDYKLYVNNIQNILDNNITKQELKAPPKISENSDSINDLSPTERETEFREKIEKEDRWNYNPNISKKQFFLFKPVNGYITENFDPQKFHYAIDIACNQGDQIKAVADGTIIFSDFTSATGYTVIIVHRNGMLSAYKHNSQLYKKKGDLVKSGEVIAEAGSGGEFSTGPHLHFELWLNGIPIDPTTYIDFS